MDFNLCVDLVIGGTSEGPAEDPQGKGKEPTEGQIKISSKPRNVYIGNLSCILIFKNVLYFISICI